MGTGVGAGQPTTGTAIGMRGAAGRLVSGKRRTLHEAEYSGIKALFLWTKVPDRPERIRGMVKMRSMAG
jgi:hypothetical protein